MRLARLFVTVFLIIPLLVSPFAQGRVTAPKEHVGFEFGDHRQGLQK